MRKSSRILALLAVGGVTILGTYANKDRLQDLTRDIILEHFVDSGSEAPKISQKISLDDRLMFESGEKLGLGYEWGFNERDLAKYKMWINQTIQETKESPRPAVIIDKAAFKGYVVDDGKVEFEFPVALGANPYSDKYIEGDEATPEGMRQFTWRRDGKVEPGITSFYRTLMIDYPTEEDKKELEVLKEKGLVKPLTSAGGAVALHGYHTPDSPKNWTDGCVGATNNTMDKIFDDYGFKAFDRVTIVRYGMENRY